VAQADRAIEDDQAVVAEFAREPISGDEKIHAQTLEAPLPPSAPTLVGCDVRDARGRSDGDSSHDEQRGDSMAEPDRLAEEHAADEEHSGKLEPAGVHPYRLRKVESLAMIVRLMRSFGGITVQPALALADARLEGLAVLPLADTRIDVRWEIVRRAEVTGDELAMVDSIRRSVQAGP